jgi:L-fuculose-phosphate aldolase
MDYTAQRDEIVEVGKRLYAKNFVASNDGNISARLSYNEIMITPSGVSKGYMNPADMIITDLNGTVLSGGKMPSSEIKMHLAVYQKRSDVKAIVHAHPQKATAFAVAHIPIDKIALPEVIFSLGMVSLAEYGTPTTPALPQKVVDKICGADALILENHGALTVGKDLMDAYYKMETLEHFCSIIIYARLLGGEKFLDDSETNKLFSIRKEVYGKEMPHCSNCGFCSAIGNTPGHSCAAPLDTVPDAGALKEQIIRQTIEEVVRQVMMNAE